MGFKVAIGKSQKKDLLEAIQEATKACFSQIPIHEISMALIFSSPEFAVQSLLKHIQPNLKANTPLLGCSAIHLITGSGIQKEGLVIVLLSLPNTKIACGFTDVTPYKNAFSSGQELGTRLMANFQDYRRELCLLISDGLSEYTPELIQGLQSIIGRSFPFFGGGSSDNFEFKRTSQYYGENIFTKNTVAALLGGKLSYGIGIRHGWKPLGKIRTVTESKTNILRKIDDKKASQLYEDYFAKTLSELKKEITYINVLYPIGIYLEGENEYLLRNIVSLNDDGSITTQGSIPSGSAIRLMISTKESCLEAARQAALQVQHAMHYKKICFALAISSASRVRVLGRAVDKEVKAIKEVLGENTPLAGFYSYGEYAPLGATTYHGQTYSHNQTIAIVGIGE
ncbi:MAG: hypothetical protein A2Y00_05710 [Omnitrophica WOR_2 bacterium GWF2_43_52]|nr:MAG: hypothetical protein A2Y00_05710 [Omnitrophica WOR_2 bacterium GWF2_43_52]OGX57565.1 MAG: hypothetical protein A2460_00380 [Omnitrophica WOR_2 bacterium RIFOXYC2_FULL_43_9]HAH21586.1 hypothetical protein [Candidatus Omnitrophota bacterium]HBG64181.1 hypothetical protein [Candidatus Omnitrophota bacterium]HCD38616.1 hypothetical protein [Candidatus Omnitrophota bacterium]